MADIFDSNAGGVFSDWTISGIIDDIIDEFTDDIKCEIESALAPLYQPLFGPYKQLQYPQNLDSEQYILFTVKKRLPNDGPSNQPIKRFSDRDIAAIALPVPVNLSDSRSVNYSDSPLGIVGGLGAGGSNISGENIKGDVVNLINKFGFGAAEQVGKQAKDFLTTEDGKIDTAAAASAFAVGFAGTKLGMLPGGFAAGTLVAQYMKGYAFKEGIAYNPRMAVLFEGVNFRTFTFNYKMIARDATESEKMQEIAQTFQTYMMPSYDESISQSIFTYPEEFQIEFSKPIRKQLFDFQPCVLKNVAVSYNEDSGPAFFEGTNAPVSMTLSLTFQETKILTKENSKKTC